MLRGKRIFVSGGAGVIGQALIQRLFHMGADLFVGDLKPRPNHWHLDIRYRQGDLNYLTKEELLEFSPHYVFHLAAAFERSTESYDFWNENYRHNVKLSHHVMDCMKEMPELLKVVFASSYLIYDPALYQFAEPQREARSLNEEAAIYPRNQCGAAKLLHEIELRFLSEFRPFESVCARIYRVYGKNSRDIISRWIQALWQGEKLTVFRKEGIFDYIYADDVAEGLIRLAHSKATGIVNLGTQNARSVNDVLTVLKNYFPSMEYSEEPSDIPFEASQANMDRFMALTGWRPSRQLEETIPELVEHYRARANENVRQPGPHNLLVTSVSRKVPLIQSVKQAIAKLGSDTELIGADLNPECIGSHFTDRFWEMPPLRELSVETLIDYCKRNHVRSIVPTRDGELLFFSRMKETLAAEGISVMVSGTEAVEACLDKLLFSAIGEEMGFPVIPVALSIEELRHEGSYVVKERFGAGSQKIGLGLSKDEALLHAGQLNQPLFQPYIEGKEFSVDLYVDSKGTVKGIVARTRDLVLNGESQITTAVDAPLLEQTCVEFASRLGLYGHVVFQIIVDASGQIHIVECNSRFGGASSLSVEMGLDSFYWFILESMGQELESYPFLRSKRNKKLVRYPGDLIV
ncbi:NAD-dependent epimerase/dehydratase family protein [Cohnella suwonensis]|uniref:NAD-dependent epimerase/dehydratase family protein n=1 Tax=Cohnella suwonensis TaxID=696072 RepID=A0ABW0LV36_9BACL